ncbi:MAG: TCR/Tet family MFS transporter [Burkholderiales bacterium]|nr:TCR/Tet family MFS transporter [Burkholderiales bacterium]
MRPRRAWRRDGASRAALAFILVTVALDVLGIGLVIPVLPKLVERFAAGDTRHAVWVLGTFGTLYAALQFLCMPLMGALSDRHGRRPVVLLSTLGMGLGYTLMALAPSMGWLFVARAVAGITSANIATANAYIADVTPPEKRAGAFGLVGAAFGLGFVVGPAAGGALGAIDLHLPFAAAAVLCVANFVYGLFVLPESLPPAQRAPRLRGANPLLAGQVFVEHPQLLPLTGVLFLSAVGHAALPGVFVLFTGLRFGWNALDVGLVLAFVGVCSATVQGGLVRRIVPAIGERRALVLGLAAGATGFAGYAVAPSGAWLVACVPVMAFWGLAGPSGQSLATAQVGGDEQGRLQGALSAMTAVANVVGPMLFAGVFALCTGPEGAIDFPGGAFVVAAALLGVAAFAAHRATRQPAAPSRGASSIPETAP